jgi:hypothetical protein
MLMVCTFFGVFFPLVFSLILIGLCEGNNVTNLGETPSNPISISSDEEDGSPPSPISISSNESEDKSDGPTPYFLTPAPGSSHATAVISTTLANSTPIPPAELCARMVGETEYRHFYVVTVGRAPGIFKSWYDFFPFYTGVCLLVTG